MKNSLWIILILVVAGLSSCITAAQFNNAEDDVYYSPKASNKKQPVMIPEVDVDEIIRKNPPQYGTPTNRIDDDQTTNPLAAQYYPLYKAYQDSLNVQNARTSSYYVDPEQATPSETQEAERLRRMYSGNSSNWNVGVGLNWWGPTFSIGYGNYNNGWNNGYYGYNGFYGYDGYCGYNGYYAPFAGPYYGWGYGGYYNSCFTPYYGWGYNNYGCGNGYWGGSHPDYRNTNTGNQSISHSRQSVGNTTPPANSNGGRSSVNTNTNAGSGQYVAPATGQSHTEQPPQPAVQSTGRSGVSGYTPASNAQTLENVNGRQVYRRPAEVQQQAPQNTTPSQGGNQSGGRSSSRSAAPSQGSVQPSGSNNNAASPSFSAPSNGGRSSGGSGGGRGSSGGSGGSSSGGGGRRR